MTKPEPRSHHYVHVALLKRFTDDDGWLHAYRPADPKPKVFRKRPEERFKKRDLYATKTSDGRAERGMETALSRFEGESEQVMARIIEAARAGARPKPPAAHRLRLHA